MLAPGHDLRARIALALAAALLQAGRFDQAEVYVDQVEADLGLRAEAVLLRQEWLTYARPQEVVGYSDRELPPAIARFERLGDQRLLAKAHLAQIRVYQIKGAFGPAVDEAFAAAGHARRAGDRGLLSQALTFASWALLFGPTDRETTERRMAEIDPAEAGPIYEAFDTGARAIMAGRAGCFDEARMLYATTLDMLEQVGLETLRHGFSHRTSAVELESGHPAEAVTQLQHARDELERLGERAYRSTCTAYLANALYADGRGDEADETARAAEAESAEDDSINFAVAHGVRARVAADRGDVEAAERLAESAVGYAFRMDMPKPRGDALLARACVLRTIGKRAEAEEVFAEAIAVYERKGELAAATRARLVFDEA